MKIFLTVGFLFAFTTSICLAKDPVVSGPSVGGKVGPYSFLVASGPQRGQPTCYVCETAEKPGLIVFARSTSPALGKLLLIADQAMSERPKGELTAWMTVLGEKTISMDELGKWVKDLGLKSVPTGIFDDPVGPPSFRLSPNADVTVLLFANRKVTANFAFSKDQLDEKQLVELTQAIQKHGKAKP